MTYLYCARIAKMLQRSRLCSSPFKKISYQPTPECLSVTG